jgi:hypothetical protein
VTTITEYLWKFEYTYEMLAYRGTGEAESDRLQLRTRTCSHQITTTTDSNPRKEYVVRPICDVNITWLLCRLQGQGQGPSSGVFIPNFSIDRASEACRTPSNNPNVVEASECFNALASWTVAVFSYFTSHIYPLMHSNALDLSAINAEGVFVPVLPLLNKGKEADSTLVRREQPEGDIMFGVGDINSFLGEEQRSLNEKFSAIDATFKSDAFLVSSVEARYLVTLLHMREVVQFYQSGIHMIEEMLRNQLVAAIGKVVSPVDFSNYMRFHNNKVFAEAYKPKPFCYAVRRSTTHSPEGVLSIEEKLSDGSMPDPIYTVCSGPADGSLHPMTFTLNAATSVTIHGERYVHAWLCQKFAYTQYDTNESQLFLKANARQFSSYIVLIGRISGASTFDPKFGMIIQNKDELSIPLDLERIPSAKEFKDAIDSLSPEQQAFAKAFRGMQLESTLFGVCVVQIKPQLEKLLRLCPDSLTKEIRLTQDLMELFITYQLPSDLLSFGGEDSAPSAERIAEVKGYVGAMQEMIQASKARELEEKKEHDRFNAPPRGGGGPPPPCPPPSAPCSSSSSFAMAGLASSAPAPLARMRAKGQAPTQSKSAPPPVQAIQKVVQKVADSIKPSTTSTPRPAEEPAGGGGGADAGTGADYTAIPGALERRFEQLDKEGAVRPTIINPGSMWTKRAQKALLADPTTSTLGVDEQKREKSRAFDLLDALSRSGGLSVEHASLHVVVAATHCFDLSLMDTIVKNNVNPIERVERSTMVMASTIHGRPVGALLQGEHRERLGLLAAEMGGDSV